MSKEKNKIKAPSPVALNVDKVNYNQLGIICSFFALILYVNTIGYDYMVDDGTVIKNNKLTTAGIKSIPEIFSSAYRAGFWNRNEGLYRPLSVAMFAVEWQLAPDQPWLGHLINVLLYILTAWFLYHFLRNILNKHHPLIPFFITLLYIVLPVHTEVVSNIKSRDEILCFFFGIIAFQQLYNWLLNKKIRSLIISLFIFFLALLSKESAITLIVLFPLFVYFFSSAKGKEIIFPSILYFLVGLIFLGLRYSVIGMIGGHDEIQLINNSLVGTNDSITRFATAVYIMGKYLLLLVFPVTLVFDYSYNSIPLVGLSSLQALVSLAVYLALAWYVIKNFNRRNPIVFGILFFTITISLVSNILFLIEATLAERFLYIPSLGFSIAIVLSLTSFFKINAKNNGGLIKQVRSNTAFLLLTVAIFFYSLRTVARNMDWKNNLTLLAKDVKSAPNSARIRYAYGSAILVEQALKEEDKDKKREFLLAAVNQLEKGVSLIEDYAEAWYHLGVAYKEMDDATNAIRAFEKCRSYKPFTEPEKLIASGLAYGMAQQYDKAVADFNAAIQMDSTSIEALNNMGLSLCDAGRYQESISALNQALRIKPDYKMALYNLGNTYARMGDYRTAMIQYNKALKVDSRYSDALNNIGNCYASLNQRDSARSFYEKAVVADPTNTKALINMGVVLHQMGDTVNEKIWFEKARQQGANL